MIPTSELRNLDDDTDIEDLWVHVGDSDPISELHSDANEEEQQHEQGEGAVICKHILTLLYIIDHNKPQDKLFLIIIVQSFLVRGQPTPSSQQSLNLK